MALRTFDRYRRPLDLLLTPASATMSQPFMNELSSEARKKAALANLPNIKLIEDLVRRAPITSCDAASAAGAIFKFPRIRPILRSLSTYVSKSVRAELTAALMNCLMRRTG